MKKTSPPVLFSEARLLASLRRAKAIAKPDADFLAKVAAEIIAERIAATNRDFDITADLQSRGNQMTNLLTKSGKANRIITADIMIFGDEGSEAETTDKKVAVKPDTFPFEENSVNLVTSLFGLHWSNDLPGILAQIHRALAPDGLFLAVLPGDRTLNELRSCLLEADSLLAGSAALRVDPFGEIRQFGGLLQRAGFTLPVADAEILTVRYSDMKGLVDDLRAMGATGNLANWPRETPRKLFETASDLYNEKFSDPDGKIRATFELVFLSGWKPHSSQQKPLKPGSAKNNLKDFL